MKIIVRPLFLAALATAAGFGRLAAQAPGGVSAHLKLWLKAGEGVTATGWADQSGNGNNALLSGTAPTAAASAASNYNAALAFNNGGYAGNFSTPLTGNTLSAFVIYMGASNSSAGRGILSITGPNGVDNTDPGSAVIFYNDVADAVASNRENVIRARSSGIRTSFRLCQMNFTGIDAQVLLYKDGVISTPVAYPAQPAFNATRYGAGARLNATGPNTYQRGSIAEMILYDTLLTPLDAQKVTSYLAFKYGIALNPAAPPTYINGAGTPVWDAALNAGYNFSVAGIGLDNATGLNQPKTRSAAAANILTLTAASPLSNGTYMVVGNNGRIPFTTRAEGAPAGVFMSQAAYKVQVTGAPASVVYGFSNFEPAQKLFWIIDADNDGDYADETPRPLVFNPASGDFEGTATLNSGQTFRLAYPVMEGLAWSNAMAGANSGFFSSRSTQEAYAYVAAGENLNLFLRKMRNGTNSSGTDGDMQLRITSPSGIINTYNVSNAEPAGKTLLNDSLTDAAAGIWSMKYTVVAGSGASPGNPANAQISDKYEWGAIVKNSAGQSKLGRVYVKNITLTNENDGGTGQNGFVNSFGFYHHSADGYRYRSMLRTFNGVDSRFGTNNSGIVLNNSCVPYYQSISNTDTTAAASGTACNAFKQYFNIPDGSMPATAAYWDTVANASTTEWLYTNPIIPTVSITSFVPNAATPTPQDGTLYFTAAGFSGNLWVDVDANGDGSFTGTEDTSIMANVPYGGSGSLVFNGKDRMGNDIPAAVAFKCRVRITKLGEIHFVLADVEGIAGGLEVVRLNGASAGADLLYWNDTTLTTPANCPANSLLNGLAGVPSTGGVHGWINDATGGPVSCGGFGNNRFVDSWAFGADVNISSAAFDVPLPVSISSFSATAAAACSVLVKWHSTAEQHSKKYIVQYSADGRQFVDVAAVTSQNRAAGAHYQVLISNPASGAAYFRLKAVDADDRFTTTGTVAVTLHCGNATISLWPSPARETLVLTGFASSGQLKIYGADGRLLGSKSIVSGTQQVDISYLPKGIYMAVVVPKNGAAKTFRVIKE